MDKALLFARMGAVVYIIWAVLHAGAAYSIYALGAELDASHSQARIFQNAWHLALIAAIAAWIAATRNWRNDRFGFWLNAVMVSATDIGFILLVAMPGYVPAPAAIIGPATWLLALGLTMMGRILVTSTRQGVQAEAG